MSASITAADLVAALPDVTSPQRFRQLRSQAVIRRDRWGIPHIKARDEYDLFFAQGFATAQDRLFQMDFDRLRALGRAAEYLGSGALQQDRFMRRRRIERVSRLDYHAASRPARTALDAYADGVNAFLETTKAMPVEYRLLRVTPERWEPWHCIAVYKVRNTAEGSFQGKLWLCRLAAQIGVERAARLSPGYRPGSLLTVPPGARYSGAESNAIEALRAAVACSTMLQETNGGSNAWVVGGGHTESGLPLVAGDPHRSLDVPNVYYQTHLIGPDLAVIGYSIPGFPMLLHFCHNEHVGWGMTHGNVDTQDLFAEKFQLLGEELHYLRGRDWVRAECTTEVLKIREGGCEQVEIVETCHGPVVAGDPRHGIALTLADPGSMKGTAWVDAAYQALRATSGNELEAALEAWTDRVNNYVYGDIHGNFGYALRGKVPIRTSANGWGPVSGWTGAYEWQRDIQPAEMPRSRNPRAGWSVSCNQRIVDETYPYFLTHFFGASYRAERLASRLIGLVEASERQGRKITIADMTLLHADIVSIPALSLQKALRRAHGLSGRASVAATALLDWDCALRAESGTAALYQATAARLAERLMSAHYHSCADDLRKSEPGAEDHWRRHLRPTLIAAMERGDESWVPNGESWNSLLSAALEAAATELETRLGTDWSRWRWGDLHKTRPQHPLSAVFPGAAALLNPPAIETPGDADTPLVAGWKTGADFSVSFTSVGRYIHDPSNWSNSRWIVPLGASGHPGSAHYSDQLHLWAAARTVAQLWDWDDVGRHIETEQELAKA
jgi:penicillin amidase